MSASRSIQLTYTSAEPFFDIGGNKYRLSARVNFEQKKVFVLYVLTHAEYDKGDWK
jgi:mRNA interferase HigB